MTPAQRTHIQNVMTGLGLTPVFNDNHYRPGIKAPVIDAHGIIVPDVFYFAPNNVNFVFQLSFENGAMLNVIPTFNSLCVAGLLLQHPSAHIGGGGDAGYSTIYLSAQIDPDNFDLIAATLTGMIGFVHVNI